MSNIDRYRPPREGYQPPSLPPKPPQLERPSKSPAKRREVPPAVPSPPSHTQRSSPPRPHSRRSAPSPAVTSPLHQRTVQHRPNQWFFTADEVASSPSILDGLSVAEERLRRSKGVNFIYQAGIILELPQLTLWVAGVFFNRFFMRYSMVEEKGGIHHYNIAATALFLANKTEENCRKTKDLIIAVAKVAQKNTKLIIDEQSKEYWRWRDSILTCEELMLETLTFDLMIENPYQRLYESLRDISLVDNKRLREAAWAFCNDSCLTVLPLLLGPRDIALSSIFFAVAITNEKVNDINGEPWWEFLKGNEENMTKAVDMMLEFYKENPLRKQDSNYPGSPEFTLENTRRRGETILSQTEADSSHNGTPMGTDRGTESPRPRANGRGHRGDAPELKREIVDDNTSNSFSRNGPGDSDTTLKVAANDLAIHGPKENGSNARSPGVKRELDGDQISDGGRDSKRAKTVDEDEGEVQD